MSSGTPKVSAARPDLPDFATPPVNEVVLSAQFDPLADLQAGHLGLLWSRFRSMFPNVEQQPALPTQPPEDFSGVPRPIELQVQMLAQPPLPRLMFVSDRGTELLQVQNDRFIANWRRLVEDDVYPRYEYVRGYFDEGFREFLRFLDEEGFGPIRLRQCEVIYLNQLPAGEGWQRPGEISEVLSFWGDSMSDDALPAPEAASAALQFLVPNAAQPRARLFVDVRPSIRVVDRHALLAMNLTARIPVDGGAIEEALDAVDFGRSWIVRAFASLTTAHMHEVWGRRDVDS